MHCLVAVAFLGHPILYSQSVADGRYIKSGDIGRCDDLRNNSIVINAGCWRADRGVLIHDGAAGVH